MTDPFSDNEFRGALALLADAAPEPSTTDLVAAQAAWAVAHRPAWPVRALRAGRRALRSRPWVAWPVLAAAVAAVVLLAVAVVPSVRLSAPQPAAPPTGPGALPQRVYAAPPWTPSATAAPIPRAAYVVTTARADGSFEGAFAVGADGGTYRRLPDGAGGAVLSPDGRRLAWLRPSTGQGNRRSEVVVDVLDLPTGLVRSMTVPSRFGVTTKVDGMDFDADGGRLLLWGGDSWDDATSVSVTWLADLGPAGTRQRPRLQVLCGCAGPLAWLAEGRIGVQKGNVPTEVPPDLELVILPDDPTVLSLLGSGRLLVDSTGTTRWGFTATNPSEGDLSRSFRLLRATSAGAVPAEVADLGTAVEVEGLAVTSAGPVLVRSTSVGVEGARREEVVRTTAGTVVPVTRVDDGVSVVAVARDVAESARTAATPAPVFGTDTSGWWAWHARTPLAVLGVVAGFAGALWLLVRLVSRPRRWRRPTRYGLRLTAGTLCAATGLAVLAAAPVVESAWTASAARPLAGAPTVVPQVLLDQRVRPPRAFDAPGVPRTTALTVAFAGRVAGRSGVYGLDAGTARVVRLDDLTGMPSGWPGAGTFAMTLSPSGRWLALWTDDLADPRVALVDLARARVTVRSDVPHAGAVTDGPWAPLRLDDSGALASVGNGSPDPAVQRMKALGQGEVLAAQTAPDGTTAGVVRTSDGWKVLGGSGGDPTGQVASRLRGEGRGPDEGRFAVAAGALSGVAGQVQRGTGPNVEPWWTLLGERAWQPLGWALLALAGLLLLPAAGRAWRTMVRRT